jgi:hypothetical protein
MRRMKKYVIVMTALTLPYTAQADTHIQQDVSVIVSVGGIGQKKTTTPGVDVGTVDSIDTLHGLAAQMDQIEVLRQTYLSSPTPERVKQLHGVFKAIYLSPEGPTYNRETFLSLDAANKTFEWYSMLHGEKVDMLLGNYHFKGSTFEMTEMAVVVGGVRYDDVIPLSNGLAFEYKSDRHFRIYSYSGLNDLLWLDYSKMDK